MMKGQDLSEAYASGDIFVMPSETETLGFVVLEAMASGIPVVAVAAGGLTDILTRPGETGLLYPSNDYNACVAHVRRLIEDKEAARDLGAAGRAEVEAFGWSAATRKIREQQYARAIRLSAGKKRFWWLALRVRTARTLRALAGMLGAWVAAVVSVLDYARAYRPPPVVTA
jgi:sulfoquinovosyltransferase